MRLLPLVAVLALTGCDILPAGREARSDSEVSSSEFPKASRPVAPIIASRWSTEDARDQLKEADLVMTIAGITPGMTVADIGAGEGYYTVRLAARVGSKGRVLAQDIVPAVRDKLADRVTRENLENVSVKLGGEADPKLPANSFDRVFLVHMYHEVGQPLEFLWRLRPSLRVGGRLIVVDANRAIKEHGTPDGLLECEMRATGFRQVDFQTLPQAGGYLAAFEVSGNRPEPKRITPCSE
jgi:ubiquinone/menaquinone biosynthesis C-methylase UbiE